MYFKENSKPQISSLNTDRYDVPGKNARNPIAKWNKLQMRRFSETTSN